MKKYYIGHLISDFDDGGQSRNKAFMQVFLKAKASIVTAYDKNILLRILFGLNVLRFMFFSKNYQIFIHQGTLITLFPMRIMKYSYMRKSVFKLIQHMVNRNDVTIEVNDLPYEQSKDLELIVSEVVSIFQENLYSIKKAKYVFASNEMGRYVDEKYGLNYKVVINGSDKLKKFSSTPVCFDSLEKKYIYAGSLNKGRQIELLIKKFSDRNELLILIGEWGEWLLDYKLSSNVFYLGKFKEDYAHYLTSKCDIGIIPYDEERFYYNICYPTKASFYITAGIPFLSTPLTELKNIFGNTGMAFFEPIQDWEKFMDNLDSSILNNAKLKIEEKKHNFYWTDLLDRYFLTV